MQNRPKVIVVGLVRNCGKSLEREYRRLLKACGSLEVIDSFFIESDSSDNSLDILKYLSSLDPNLHYESLGDLVSTIPDRIERIRFCRNQYVGYIRSKYLEGLVDFVIVADMDGINSALTRYSVDSCFQGNTWDCVFSNQLLGISDLLALRADNWIEEDYLVELEQSRTDLRKMPESDNIFRKIAQLLRYDKTRRTIIYNRMRCIGIGKELIPVDSAFGGIGIYRSWCFFHEDYTTEQSPQECEHVSFHKKLQASGANMYINPRFINSIINTFNINKFFIIRNLRMWRWNRKKSER
jgi:hypothetical protein